MSNIYGFTQGPSLLDLISALKGVSQNGGYTLQSLSNVFPPPTASTSPVFIAVNNLGTVGTTVMNATTGLAGLIVHNPGTANLYFYSLSLGTTPTLSALGGTLEVLPGAVFAFPSINYANFNVGLGAFVATGAGAPLTIMQFF